MPSGSLSLPGGILSSRLSQSICLSTVRDRLSGTQYRICRAIVLGWSY